MEINELISIIETEVSQIENLQQNDLDMEAYSSWNSFITQLVTLSIMLDRSDPEECNKYPGILHKMQTALHEAEPEIKEMVSEPNQEYALKFYHNIDTALQDYCRSAHPAP